MEGRKSLACIKASLLLRGAGGGSCRPFPPPSCLLPSEGEQYLLCDRGSGRRRGLWLTEAGGGKAKIPGGGGGNIRGRKVTSFVPASSHHPSVPSPPLGHGLGEGGRQEKQRKRKDRRDRRGAGQEEPGGVISPCLGQVGGRRGSREAASGGERGRKGEKEPPPHHPPPAPAHLPLPRKAAVDGGWIPDPGWWRSVEIGLQPSQDQWSGLAHSIILYYYYTLPHSLPFFFLTSSPLTFSPPPIPLHLTGCCPLPACCDLQWPPLPSHAYAHTYQRRQRLSCLPPARARGLTYP